MKKVALILLIGVYTVATMGFSIRQFFCCGKFKSASVTLIQDTKQHCGKGTEKSGCCNNKYQFFKINDKHISADHVNSPAKYFIYLNLYTPSFREIHFESQNISTAYRSNAPPLDTGISLCIYNSVFRI